MSLAAKKWAQVMPFFVTQPRGKDIGDYWDVFKFICVYSPDTATYWLVNPSISMKGNRA